MLAPWSRRKRAALVSPCLMAECRRVSPWELITLTSAPALIKSPILCCMLHLRARASSVRPSLFLRFKSAQLLSSSDFSKANWSDGSEINFRVITILWYLYVPKLCQLLYPDCWRLPGAEVFVLFAPRSWANLDLRLLGGELWPTQTNQSCKQHEGQFRHYYWCEKHHHLWHLKEILKLCFAKKRSK